MSYNDHGKEVVKGFGVEGRHGKGTKSLKPHVWLSDPSRNFTFNKQSLLNYVIQTPP